MRRLGGELGDLFTRGAVAGIAAGFVFLLANMVYATSEGKPSLAPFMDISTIFHGTDKPASTTPTLDMLATGAVVHISLSIAFGIVFALLVGAFAPVLRNWLGLAVGGVGYGLALYVVNFQIFGNTLFPWFERMTEPWFQLLQAAGRSSSYPARRSSSSLPDRLHHAELDRVVDELDEMPRAGRPDEDDAFVVDCEVAQDRLGEVVGVPRAADHEACSAARAVD